MGSQRIKTSGVATAWAVSCISRHSALIRSEKVVSTARGAFAPPETDSVKPIRPSEEFLIFGAPLICDEEEHEIVRSLKTGWLGTGPKVAQLEREFREYKGAPYAVAVNSCTAALHLGMLAAGIGPGDEVITTALT